MSYVAYTGDASAPGSSSYRHVRPMSLVHTMKPGETLDSVASIYGTDAGTLRMLNQHTLGQQTPHAGQRITIG